ncbi:MAG: alpha/beta fold hydrolase [Pseudomonadales bacterium]|nr:alpha/beta fold hydrolase [Pseudomonadales bacterium]
MEAKIPSKHSSPHLSKFADALTDYVLDPTTWERLTDQLDQLDWGKSGTDPGELLVQLSKAETLSWQIKKDTGDLAGGGFAFVLLNDQDKIVAHSNNLPQLGEYLTISASNALEFSDTSSRDSLKAANAKLRATPHGHILVEIAHPKTQRHRYGYLVGENEFPEPLRLLGEGATCALLIAHDQPNANLRNIVQASFSLTAAETDLMLKIASGMTLKAAASELGVSINTVRNHLQAIYAKSGVNRQGDLVLVVTQLSIILAATGANSANSSTDVAPNTEVTAAQQHFIILPDGRRMAYRTYGNPMGRPVLYLHENIGSSRLLPDTQRIAENLNLYIVAPERPGCGYSDPNPDFKFESVCQDLEQFLDHLRIQDCQILGFLSGGGYALKMADIYPERVTQLNLVASRPPGPQTGRFQLLATIRQKMVKQPWVMSTFFNILRNRASEETFGNLIMSVYGSVPHDRSFLEARPDIFQHMVAYTLESMSISTAGVINELQCFNSTSGETLPNLQAPITVWHGTDDGLASLEDIQQLLGERIGQTNIFPNAGSLILLEHWTDILADVAKNADDL